MIGQLNLVFTAIRQHGWASDLPTRAMFFPENRPKEAKALPSALSEHVMVQLEQPDNLKMKREAPVSIDEELEVHRRAPRQRRCRTARQ
ncbi:hypothetical protein B0I32_14134 [Nonomuraea fuscirosea]|uniref:Uncharacterized protein n=1 Tax=Nonomuraea fuscirosea TaxID=1291556 RepID=A0A2T0LVY2_9ACTN|nr:hypothetical protein [Nonomuraea fuscirosea]PRX48078.1 hypothetical protein B0I32_14134 [Nonomuraea fuscirosea]